LKPHGGHPAYPEDAIERELLLVPSIVLRSDVRDQHPDEQGDAKDKAGKDPDDGAESGGPLFRRSGQDVAWQSQGEHEDRKGCNHRCEKAPPTIEQAISPTLAGGSSPLARRPQHCCPEQEDRGQPPEGPQEVHHPNRRDSREDHPSQTRREERGSHESTGRKPVRQWPPGEVRHHGNDAVQGKRGSELEIRDPEHVEERRAKDASQDEGQEEDCLTRGDKSR